MARFAIRSRFDVGASELFAWHGRVGAIERLVPPWERVVVEESKGTLADARVVFRMRGPLGPMRWIAEHRDFVPGRQFRDEQVKGPFAHWVHTHTVEADPAGGSTLTDDVEYRLPMGALGAAFGGGMVRRRLDTMFAFRHRRTREDLERHARFASLPRRRIAITGSTGFVGSSLGAFLSTGGHEVVPLVRGAGRPGVAWDPARGTIDAAGLEGVDALVHLAGENVGDRRWTAARRQALIESRVASTRLLVKTVLSLSKRPRVLLCASAVGIYGDRGDELLDEAGEGGRGFLADLVRAWEAEARPAIEAGVRVVHLRFGVVLGARGGALKAMLTPFRLGLGGPMGSGRQWMPWVSIDDVLGAIHDAVLDERFSGPINVVAPVPVRQTEFAKCLGAVLRRPAFAPMPALAARVLFGERAKELLLASQRIEPRRLSELGFRWQQGDLEGALRFQLGRWPAAPA